MSRTKMIETIKFRTKRTTTKVASTVSYPSDKEIITTRVNNHTTTSKQSEANNNNNHSYIKYQQSTTKRDDNQNNNLKTSGATKYMD